MAGLTREDIVLEVGAGLGFLTSFLVERVAFVHAIELDRGLEPHLHGALAAAENVSIVIGDALGLPLGRARAHPCEARRESSVLDRHSASRREPRRAARARVVVRHAPTRGRRPHRGLAGDARLRRGVGPRSADGRTDRFPPRRTDLLPSATQRRLGPSRAPLADAGGVPSTPASSGSSRERSPTAERRSRTRSSSPGSPREPRW